MEKPKKLFLVRDEGDDENSGYWNQYDSLEDAVSDKGDGTEVFTATPKLLGTFNRKTVMVKLKRKRRRQAQRKKRAIGRRKKRQAKKASTR